jgi:hypothetical protein
LGILLASSTREVAFDNGVLYSIRGADSSVLYRPDETNVYTIIRHDQDGPLFVSQFDANQDARFHVVEIRPIIFPAIAERSIPCPPVREWSLSGKLCVRHAQDNTVEVDPSASDSEWSLTSPWIDVLPGWLLELQMPISPDDHPHVGVGVLDETGAWIAGPNTGLAPQVFRVPTGHRIRVVIRGPGLQGAKPRSTWKFTCQPGGLSLCPSPDRHYVDDLCEPPNRDAE